MSTKPYIVGLTGGIGSGKSTVARAFVDLGIEVVDADHASRKIVERGMPALKFIADRFGGRVIDEWVWLIVGAHEMPRAHIVSAI